MTSVPNTPTRADLMLRALRLEAITIVWMVIEASAAIGAGLMAGSVLLLAFGVDSVIELTSAGLLYYRLSREAKAPYTDVSEIEQMERRAARIGGYLLYALVVYVIIQSGYGLLHRHSAEVTFIGIGVAIIAALGMPLLAKVKLRVADEIGSKALRADAMETFTCGFLSWVLLAGLITNALLHWWWVDSVGAFALVPFLIKEGKEAIAGDCGCSHS